MIPDQMPAGTYATVLGGRDPVGTELERVVVWADRPYDRCPSCHQKVGYEHPQCPVMLNAMACDGGQIETWDLKHDVCGEWLSVSWREVTGGQTVEEVAAELLREVNDEIETLRAITRRGLIRMMREALARLDEPLDEAAGETREEREREVFGGSEVTPGIYRDGDRIVAWEYDPAGRDVEGVAITDLDLA